MDAPIIRDCLRFADGLLKLTGLKSSPPPPPPPPAPSASSMTSISSIVSNNLSRSAGLSGTLAILLGVYGAHALKDASSEEIKRLFQLAQTYHLLHSVALLGLPLVSRPYVTGSLFIGGMMLFCGPMYYHAMKNDPKYRRFTPYGGILLLFGWFSVLIL